MKKVKHSKIFSPYSFGLWYFDDWRCVAIFIREITKYGKIEPEMWVRK